MLGLSAFADRPITTLSGGERQIGVDGAGAGLGARDPAARRADLGARFPQPGDPPVDAAPDRRPSEGLTVVMTTHDPTQALEIADRALLLYGSDRHEEGPAEAVLTESKLSDLYGIAMRGARLADGGGLTIVPDFKSLRVDRGVAGGSERPIEVLPLPASPALPSPARLLCVEVRGRRPDPGDRRRRHRARRPRQRGLSGDARRDGDGKGRHRTEDRARLLPGAERGETGTRSYWSRRTGSGHLDRATVLSIPPRFERTSAGNSTGSGATTVSLVRPMSRSWWSSSRLRSCIRYLARQPRFRPPSVYSPDRRNNPLAELSRAIDGTALFIARRRQRVAVG